MTSKSVDFGKFLSDLATSADAATNETLEGLKAKMQKEKQDQVERKLRSIFEQIQFQVERLREIRKSEKQIQDEIKKLEERANKIVTGTEDEDDTAIPAARRLRRP